MLFDLFMTLLTGKNEVFHCYVQKKQNLDIAPDKLVGKVATKYNNFVGDKTIKKVKETEGYKLVHT